MLVGDFLEGLAALLISVAVLLILLPLAGVTIAAGGCLLVIGCFSAYEAQVWANQAFPRRKRVKRDSA